MLQLEILEEIQALLVDTDTARLKESGGFSGMGYHFAWESLRAVAKGRAGLYDVATVNYEPRIEAFPKSGPLHTKVAPRGPAGLQRSEASPLVDRHGPSVDH